MGNSYPRLHLKLNNVRNNAHEIITRCHNMSISVCGVIKGCNGDISVAKIMEDCGVSQIASTQISHLQECRKAGIHLPLMLLRVPGFSEISSVVDTCDISMHSELSVLKKLEEVCAEKGKTHSVILMIDLGDLREGFWDYDEFISACVLVEKDLPHIHLMGIGVNLSCYGSLVPTPEKMQDLVNIARAVEDKISRRLEIISGGNTTSFPLVHYGTMPEGINHLRIGETILLGYDLRYPWGCSDMDYISQDTYTFEAEIVELRTKPSLPQGTRFHDCFGLERQYEDRGMRKRALLNFGRFLAGEVELLLPEFEGIEVIGGSSDYCIADVTDCKQELHVGDILKFHLQYVNMLFLTAPGYLPYEVTDDQ